MLAADPLQEFEKVKRTLEEYFSVKVEHRDTSLKGWNWGKATVQSKLDIHWAALADSRQRSRVRGPAQDCLRASALAGRELEHRRQERGFHRVHAQDLRGQQRP